MRYVKKTKQFKSNEDIFFYTMNKIAKGKSIKKLRQKAWDLQSEYIRRTENRCFTCGVEKKWKEFDAGHFKHKDCMDFVRKNIHCQCFHCNRMRHGNLDIYADKLEGLYGFGIIQELNKMADKIKYWKVKELEEIIEFYQSKLKELQ